MERPVIRWLVSAMLVLAASSVSGQVIGDEAEMDRLAAKGEDAYANGDVDGAAMNLGKAALMAAHIAGRPSQTAGLASLYRAAETLFRGQEHAYRAIALFERAGGQPPASSGACGNLALASKQIAEAHGQFGRDISPDLPAALHLRWQQLRTSAAEWGPRLAALAAEFQCPG